jgi:glutathione S-transferase
MSGAQDFRPGNRHGLLLYDFGASPCARRCRISMLEKGLVWDTQTIDLSRLEQRSPEYLRINPNGFVPALAHGERVVYESNVITEYLDDVFPATPLYPSDPWELARVKLWQSAEAAMAKDYRTLMYQRVLGPMLHLTRSLEEALAAARRSTHDVADLAWEERVWRLAVLTPEEEAATEERLFQWLDVLERSLEGRDYLVGGRFSQAEISVFPRVAMYPYVGLRVAPQRHPNVARWMKRLARRASFARTKSQQDRGLDHLSKTPVLPWLRRTLGRPESERSRSEKLRLLLLRQLLRRALPAGQARPGATADARRQIRRPHNGESSPCDAARRALPEPDAAVLAAPLTLYGYRHSPHTRRIRILLAEKGLRYQSIEVDMARMAHKAPDYLALNPNGELPALRHGERLLYDSQLIAEYLDRSYPGEGRARLYPDDAWLAAQVRMWLALEAGTHKEFRPLFYLHVVRPELQAAGVREQDVDRIVPEGVHASHRQWLRDVIRGTPRFDTSEALAREIIRKKLDFIEAHLRSRELLVGERFTVADLAWLTRLDTFEALGIPLSRERHPSLLRWYEALGKRLSVAAADA